MSKIALADLRGLAEYEKVREDFRRRVIELKKRRRIQLGDRLSLVFENKETVLFQIQEMLRAERIVEPEKIQFELEVYGALLPEAGELSATLFIEVDDVTKIQQELDRFQGIDEGEAVCIVIGGQRIPGMFEAGRSKEDKISAVHYVRFKLSPEQQQAFKHGSAHVHLVVDHPNYRHTLKLTPETRMALAADLN